MLWKYIHHLVMEAQNDSGDAPRELLHDHMERVHDLEAQQLYLEPWHNSPVGYRGLPKPDSNPNAQHLLNFKKHIK